MVFKQHTSPQNRVSQKMRYCQCCTIQGTNITQKLQKGVVGPLVDDLVICNFEFKLKQKVGLGVLGHQFELRWRNETFLLCLIKKVVNLRVLANDTILAQFDLVLSLIDQAWRFVRCHGLANGGALVLIFIELLVWPCKVNCVPWKSLSEFWASIARGALAWIDPDLQGWWIIEPRPQTECLSFIQALRQGKPIINSNILVSKLERIIICSSAGMWL